MEEHEETSKNPNRPVDFKRYDYKVSVTVDFMTGDFFVKLRAPRPWGTRSKYLDFASGKFMDLEEGYKLGATQMLRLRGDRKEYLPQLIASLTEGL
jgi:hypothetical protein